MNKGTGKRLLAIVMALSIVMAMLPVSALGAGREEGFRDVGDGDWFRDAVDYVVSHGIFNGTSDSAFEPNGGMTRAMMVTVLGRVAQIDPDDYSGGSGFTDVEPGSWYEPYVAWAVESGITLGVGEGLFAPNDPVTRAQMALFLMRLLEYLGVDAPAAVTDGLPVDCDAIPDYAREAVELMWKSGVFEGGGDGRFDPERQLTRAEVAALLMRIDQHLVDVGAKEYPDEPQEDEDEDGQQGTVTPPWTPDGGDEPGGVDEPGGETGSVLYEPTVSDTPGTAAATDVETSFSIVVESSNTSMTAEQVKELITAVDTSNLNNEENVIDVKDNGNGTYTITGLTPVVKGPDKTEYEPGFIAGHAYKITLDDECLSFVGENDSVREYDFTAAREETLNVELREDIVYIRADRVEEEDGMLSEAGLLTVKDGEIVNAGQSVQGSFTLAKASSNGRSTEDGTPEVGDIVAVYEGTHPNERTATGTDEDNTAPISYVRITDIQENTYYYEGVETQDVLDMPEIFPVSAFADRDGEDDNNSITVPKNTFIYAGAAFNEAGFDSETEPEEGDYIAFYTGYLNTGADSDDEIKVGDPQVSGYVCITDIRLEGNNYVITYEEATLDQIMIDQSSYTSQDMDMSELLSPEELSDMEDEIVDEVMESGMAEEVAQAVVNAAMTDESLEVLQEELGLTELSVTPNGSSSSAAAALAAAGSGSSSANITVKVTGADANVKTTTERYGDSGLTVTLEISFTVNMGENLELAFTIALEQQLKIVLTASVDTVCEWLWGFIPYPDWVVSASIDVYSYTGLDIDINITTDDGVTEVTDYVDMIKDLLEEGGDESDAETLASRYEQMLQNDSDWVELFKYRIMHQKKSLAKIVNFSMEISFVVSANVNVYVGVDFWYEIGRRYSFTMQLLNSQTSNNTVSLIPEEYELEVYVMGMLGLRAGLRIDLAASLIHKKVAGVGISAEAGAYIELYGYFFYKLHYLEGSEGDADKRESQAGGNLYVEVGIYVEVGAEVEALGGLITWMPTIYSQTWPLWTAGNQYSILGFHEPAGGIGTLEFGYTDIYSVPSTVFTMDVLDMKTGKVSQTNYANIAYGNNFTIENTNSEIKDGWRNKIGLGILVLPAAEWTYVLTAAHPVEEMDRYEEGQLIITYSDPTSKLAFNTEPLQRVVDYKYDQVGDQGKHFVLNSEAEPWQMSFYDFPGKPISYDVSKFDRYGYTRLGWLDMNGSYASEEDAMDSLVPDSELPKNIPGENESSLYYMVVWEKVPVTYYVRQHYQNVDGSYPTNSEVEPEEYDDGYVEEIVTPGEPGSGHFEQAVQTLPGFDEPFTRSITVINGEGTIADFYYPRESYKATFNYVVND